MRRPQLGPPATRADRGAGTIAVVDGQELLRRARAEAGLDQGRLAQAAGVARTTLVAYESGRRSPTVRQLTQLLRTCGLQARVTLEPLSADVDRVLDEALEAGPPLSFERLVAVASSLDAAGVPWAVDGVTALAVQGLRLPHRGVAVLLLDSQESRLWLRAVWAKGWTRHGETTVSWLTSSEVVREYVRSPVWSRVGELQVRFCDELPELLTVRSQGRAVPVVPLLEVRRTHAGLAELLARYEQRAGTAEAGTRLGRG